jgi:hypothetical protein
MELSVVVKEMANRVLQNLTKNGFPEKSVSFPLETLYDLAHAKGFHFNKVRDFLNQEGVSSEIVGSKIVFSILKAPHEDLLKDPKFAESLKDPNFLDSAMSFLSNMDPEKIKSLGNVIPGISPEKMADVLNLLKTMTPEQKRSYLETAKKFMGNKDK